MQSAFRFLLMCMAWGLALAATLLMGPSPLLAQEHGENRIIVVGDLHGDYAAYRDILAAAGVSRREGRWSGGQTTLVQMGDIVDRGPQSLAIISDLRELAADAQRHGGRVIVLLGNHEAMNAMGDLRYVDLGEYEAFVDRRSPERRELVYEANRVTIEQFYAAAEPPLDPAQAREAWMADYPLGKVEHRLAWSPQGDLGSWAGQLPAAVVIAETLFVHGGLSAEYAAQPLDVLNRMVQDGMRSTGTAEHAPVLDDPLGPLWYRGNIFRDDQGAAALGLTVEDTGSLNRDLCESPCHPALQGDLPLGQGDAACTPPADACAPPRLSIDEELDRVLTAYGARRMVVAHTPSLEGIVSRPDGRLIRADTGISAHYGGPRSYLEIHHGHTSAWQKGPDGEWRQNRLPEPVESEAAVP